jgi:hypothetical protein
VENTLLTPASIIGGERELQSIYGEKRGYQSVSELSETEINKRGEISCNFALWKRRAIHDLVRKRL